MMNLLLAVSIGLTVGDTASVTFESLPADVGTYAVPPRTELKVTRDGRTTVYSGIPLAAILGKRRKPVEGMPGLRDLADATILVRGEDGYQVAVSAAAVAMDPNGERYLVAISVDGQDRKPQLIIPGDPKRTRWVRDIKAVRLARLGQIEEPRP